METISTIHLFFDCPISNNLKREIGHYQLIEPDSEQVKKYAEAGRITFKKMYQAFILLVEQLNSANTFTDFIENAKKSVEAIKIKEDEDFSFQLAAFDENNSNLYDEASMKHYGFFKEHPISLTKQDKDRIIKLQGEEMAYYNRNKS